MDISTENTLLTIIDMQEKLVPAMENASLITQKAGILAQAALELTMDVIVTQQYTKGLGPTLPAIYQTLPHGVATVEKVCFSCFDSPEYHQQLAGVTKQNLVYVGVEAHVCVMMTAVAAVEAGYSVWVLSDAVGSRCAEDRLAALEFMRSRGVRLISTESLLFMLMKASTHPAFKNIQKLLR